ncbi:cation-transporting P-type ATPase [Tardiphaga sp. vice352]|uniref:cation-translocating P-type ATPase n=1 Tax=unclassified Tardiphaga TaxID=2631404 RepID=UPI001163EC50|nr:MULTISPECIES: cation-transporting P-type ATPase [unclassified Tardiphaga]QDM15497.1 cation-transporting P-type ATPase [Tardiphaga sp. vice278]QDM20526.1 cation-transporting P-type ATPase [Tardiphaga sp. vice154]QDM25654.1 cation-transporting P-type ATPase [Tardiphaga sp. vice304]QDM30867.1 cation-transporting P-type ATPase [Tardiphaga sp. vice352]
MNKITIDLPHSLNYHDVASSCDVIPAQGLSPSEAGKRLLKDGPNAIPSGQKAGMFSILVHQFSSLVVGLLAVAAAVAFYFGEWEEGIAIVGVLFLNAAIGFVTEVKAVRSIEAIRALGTRLARVLRGGDTCTIPAESLVVGDVVLIDAGEVVSADLRLAEAADLDADESTLTGESARVRKSIDPVAANARVADRTSMLFKGTSITSGSGAGIVVATGLDTELGKISKLVSEADPNSSPLEKKLASLSGQLVWLTLALTALICGIGLLQGQDALLMVEAAIALAVAAIPEGLPIVATLALARGMWRMARKNALIERLSAVETLGATTLILTDKTGTLTENRMTVTKAWLPAGRLDLENLGTSDIHSRAPTSAICAEFRSLLEIATLCNNATLGPVAANDSGDPMELALLRAGRIAGIDRSQLLQAKPEVLEHAFDASRRMMATVHRIGNSYVYAIKGAPEMVLESSNLDEAARVEWATRVATLGAIGLRVLALGTRESQSSSDPAFVGLTFLGLVGLEDPPRQDVPEAIAACRAAGIRIVMMTGDHTVTARSIAGMVGLGGANPLIVEGEELDSIDGKVDSRFLQADIFARVSPTEKLELVRSYQAAGEIVAMTGDGVNDAPALRQADIGVAMGLRGTDVAREAAAMILLDDAFPTIVEAVRGGRVIFGNIRRFATYLLSCNLGEVLVVGVAMIAGLPLPLLPLQILFLNLVTDVFPAFALAMGEGERDILKRPPRAPAESILGRSQWVVIVLYGATFMASTFGALALARFGLAANDREIVTVTFLTLAFSQLWHVFNMRHRSSRIFNNEISRNPWIWAALAFCTAILMAAAYLPFLSSMLQLAAPNLRMWGVIMFMSAIPLLAGPAIRHVSR